MEPGTVLAGKYRLEEPLGEGGMGTIYRAEHLALKAPVAVKVIDKAVTEGDVAYSRFIREAQAAASLRSPHVVQVLDYGTEGDVPFMVMELLEGETLAGRLERVHRLTPAEAYKILSHVSRAISKAHEAGIIHRDLKPDNVFLVHNEGDEIAKVLDFGVAKVGSQVLSGTETRTGSLLGTPYYMSPEQAQGNKEIDHRSDLWALGVIAFECLTGRRPFMSDGLGDLVIQICIRDIILPSQVAPVPPGFDEWFLRAVARDPDERFQSARTQIDALADALGIVRETGPDSLGRDDLGPDSLGRPLTPYAPEVARPLTPYAPEVSRSPYAPDVARVATPYAPEAAGMVTPYAPEVARVATPYAPEARLSAEFPGRSSDVWASMTDRTLEDVRPPEFRSLGPGIPRHAVAEPLPVQASSLGRSALILGVVSMIFGSGLVFGMNRAGIKLPEVASFFQTAKPAARSSSKKNAPQADKAGATGASATASRSAPETKSDAQRKATAPKKAAAPVLLDNLPKAPSLTQPTALPEEDVLPPELLEVRPPGTGTTAEPQPFPGEPPALAPGAAEPISAVPTTPTQTPTGSVPAPSAPGASPAVPGKGQPAPER